MTLSSTFSNDWQSPATALFLHFCLPKEEQRESSEVSTFPKYVLPKLNRRRFDFHLLFPLFQSILKNDSEQDTWFLEESVYIYIIKFFCIQTFFNLDLIFI